MTSIHDVSYHSDIGGREENEDTLIIQEPENSDKVNPLRWIFGVFDGHAGIHVSKYLQKYFGKLLARKEIKNFESNTITKFCLRFHCAMMKDLGPKKSEAGSTAILIVDQMDDEYVYSINVGDSRAVACDKHNNPIALSLDHKPSDPTEKKRILYEGGSITQEEGDEERLISMLAMTRSFGDVQTLPFSRPNPDVRKIKRNRLKFIILACDGLWDVMSNHHAVKFVNLELKKNTDRKKIAQSLVEYSKSRQTADNVTVIIIFYDNVQ